MLILILKSIKVLQLLPRKILELVILFLNLINYMIILPVRLDQWHRE